MCSLFTFKDVKLSNRASICFPLTYRILLKNRQPSESAVQLFRLINMIENEEMQKSPDQSCFISGHELQIHNVGMAGNSGLMLTQNY